jgi:hypothetical protein
VFSNTLQNMNPVPKTPLRKRITSVVWLNYHSLPWRHVNDLNVHGANLHAHASTSIKSGWTQNLQWCTSAQVVRSCLAIILANIRRSKFPNLRKHQQSTLVPIDAALSAWVHMYGSNIGKLCITNGRFNALIDPVYKRGICQHTVNHPTFKKFGV